MHGDASSHSVPLESQIVLFGFEQGLGIGFKWFAVMR